MPTAHPSLWCYSTGAAPCPCPGTSPGPKHSSLEEARAGEWHSKGSSCRNNLCCPSLQSVAGEEMEEASSAQQGRCGCSQSSARCSGLLWWDRDNWGMNK